MFIVFFFFFSLQNVLLTITATESIQFDGRAVSLGSGTIHVPSLSSKSPAQAPSTTSTDIGGLRSTTPTQQLSGLDVQSVTLSPSLHSNSPTTINKTTSPLSFLQNNVHLSSFSTKSIKSSLSQLLHSATCSSPQSVYAEQSAVSSFDRTLLLQTSNLLKSQQNMPPPTPGSPAGPSPRKRRRKREDPQSYVTNSEVSHNLNTRTKKKNHCLILLLFQLMLLFYKFFLN